MVAEDHAESKKNAKAIYNVIRESLISKMVSTDRKLPLVYLIDSILKNVKGKYIPVIEADATNWLPVVYHALPEDGRAKLKKVYNLWKDAGVFSEASWKKMGTCFTATTSASSAGDNNPESTLLLEKAGITYGVRHTSIFRLSQFFFTWLYPIDMSLSLISLMKIFIFHYLSPCQLAERWRLDAHAATTRVYANIIRRYSK